MKKLVILFLFLLLPLATAATTINLKTLRMHEVNIYVLDASKQYYLVDSFLKQNSGATGEVTVTTDTSAPTINVLVHVKENNQILYNKRFDKLTTGNVIDLELPEMESSEQKTAETNSSQNISQVNVTLPSTSQNLSNETSNVSLAPATGNVVAGNSENSGFKSVYVYYIIVALIIFGIFFFLYKSRNRSSFSFSPPSRKDASYVMHLERELKNAQHEVNVLKNQEKIKDVEKKIEEEKKELDRLRRGL